MMVRLQKFFATGLFYFCADKVSVDTTMLGACTKYYKIVRFLQPQVIVPTKMQNHSMCELTNKKNCENKII